MLQRRLNLGQRRTRALLLLAAPAVVWYFLFMLGPLVSMFYLSMTEWGSLISSRDFVGLDNFERLWNDPVFWQATRNTAVQIGVQIPIMIPLAFMLGYYVNLKPRGHRVLRVILFTPALVSLSVQAMLFTAAFAPNGLLNGVLRGIGLGQFARPWLASEDTALAMIIVVGLWAGIGFTSILFAARLAAVPGELYEAAELDGAGHMGKIWRIAFPVVKDFVGVMVMLQFLWTLFASAAIVLLLTNGGPGYESTTLSFLVYNRAFVSSEAGYSQAVGVVLFVIGLFGLSVIRRVIRQNY
jgi:multiple sugar transport system permease protein